MSHAFPRCAHTLQTWRTLSPDCRRIASQAVAGVAADGRQVVNRGIGEAQQYKRCAHTLELPPLLCIVGDAVWPT